MQTRKALLPLLISCNVVITSCGQNETTEATPEVTIEVSDNADTYSEPHQYGGWYCPDNLRGFPPIDIAEYDRIKVVSDRLPTQEETRNGTSLMYFDTTKIPDARPLPIKLPQVARIHSEHNGFNELIIVIQAVVAGSDTVVGFRYPSGGNGSAWYGQVSFLTDQEITKLKPSPMIHIESEINASKEKIWEAFTRTSYAKQVARLFNEEEFFGSPWSEHAQLHLNLETDTLTARGMVSSMWGMLYMQIDYNRNGFMYTEKMMLFGNDAGGSTLNFVTGPISENLDAQQNAWQRWKSELKKSSERLY